MGGYFKWDSGQAEVPPEHASTHENGGDDEISVAGLSGELADAQTPKTHASSHQSGGADTIKLDDLAAPDDNTDLNVSTSKHGLTPKAPNDTKQFLRGDGTWAQIALPVNLAAGLESTSWKGNSFSTTAKTLLDLSAVFGVPAGVKAILVRIAIRDSGSAATDCRFYLSPEATAYAGMGWSCPTIDDRWGRFGGVKIPCNTDGDVYYQIVASGTDTFDIYLEIWGYDI